MKSSFDIFEAISNNNKLQFQQLIQQLVIEGRECAIDKRSEDSSDTALHVASRLGHAHFVSRIVRARPEFVEAVNVHQETPIHEACRGGNLNVLDLLLAVKPFPPDHWLHTNGQTPMFLACKYGHSELVKRLKEFYIPNDVLSASLHAAMSHGHADIVQELIKAWPSLAKRADENGHNVLHYACKFGEQEIAQMVLEVSPDLALSYDKDGFTPVHLAAVHNKGTIFKEFKALAPLALQALTKQGETLLHLTVRYEKVDAFLSLIQLFKDSNHDLFQCRDQDGNTPLDLAMSRNCPELAKYIKRSTIKQGQSTCNQEITLDDRESRICRSEDDNFVEVTINLSGEQQELVELRLKNEEEASPRFFMSPPKTKEYDEYIQQSEDDYISATSSKKEPLYKVAKTILSILQSEQHHRKDLQEKRMQKMNMEGLQNARNTINIIAVLIATVTFTGCLSPPGGFFQEGPHIGKAVLGQTTAFKVFAFSNDAALFLSLGIVVILVSIIPFRTTPMRRLLTVTHKVLWFAVSFLAMAYIAARWATTIQAQRQEWMFPVVLSICGGLLGVVLVGLSIKLIYDKLKKSEWKRKQVLQVKSFSIISDVISRAASGFYNI